MTAERLTGLALVGREGGKFALEEVETAPVGPTGVAVRASWTGVSIGTEFGALTGKIDYGPFPMTTGYMAVGIVESVGDQVERFHVGDRVYYGRNNGLTVKATGETITCASGAHASVAVFDPHGAGMGGALVPDGVPDDVASMFVLPCVGLLGVDMAEVGVGKSVVVIGAGLVGLSVVAAAAARGARVVAVDPRPKPRDVARELGATTVLDPGECDLAAEVQRLTDPAGADFVFESTGMPSLLDPSIELCRPQGCFVWQGNYGNGQKSFEFYHAHTRRLRMVFPCGNGGREFEDAVMRSMALGTLKWDRTITHRLKSSDAPDLYESVHAQGAGDVLGATICWS